MRLLIQILIYFGCFIMLSNICRFLKFMKNTTDVISSGRKHDRYWLVTALILLIFFLLGYIGIVTLGKPDLLMAGILFGGSIFVAIVLTLMFRLVETIKGTTISISEVLIGAIEARDPNLNGHSRYVQNLTMLIYEYLPVHMQKQLNRISLEYAALMHDVGKLGIPESILNKPGSLTLEEYTLMKEHPKIGVRILKPISTFDSISPWILYHHERMDGNGYYHISPQQIPLASRIISIADTYSAITMRRSYKEPKSYEDAIRVLKECSGTQFDEQIVTIFCNIPKDKVIKTVPDCVDINAK